jgi:hypothetical protein
MEGGKKGAGRKIGVIWAASLVATALITLFASSCYIRSWHRDANSLSLQKQALLADMRINLVRSVEKEKSSVMAPNDEQSRNYAEQSKSSSAQVDRDLKNLQRIIAQGGSDKEHDMVKKFETSWNNVHQIDAVLLESAVQNTNIKAVELSNTIGADLLRKIDDNLVKLTAKVTPPARRSQMEKLSSEVIIAVRNIAIAQSRHINAAADTDKKGIEASMPPEGLKADTALKTLDRMTGGKSRPYIKEAIADFGEFMRVNEEIVRLSHLNTNRSAVELSLGKKRLAEAECDRTLKSLQTLEAGAARSGS